MIKKIRDWSHKVLPSVYDDSLSYYEVLNKVSAKCNEVIDAVNENTDDVAEALSAANQAVTDAGTAIESANEALENSEDAIESANSALEQAESAVGSIETMLNIAEELSAGGVTKFIFEGDIHTYQLSCDFESDLSQIQLLKNCIDNGSAIICIRCSDLGELWGTEIVSIPNGRYGNNSNTSTHCTGVAFAVRSSSILPVAYDIEVDANAPTADGRFVGSFKVGSPISISQPS